jgi:Tfp pilus assembly protein PilN
MTIDIPTRAPEQQAPDGGRRGLKGGPQITFGRSRSVGKAPLVVGGQPRANLLPPEIILKRKQLKTRRALRAGVVLVAIVTVAGCVATFGVSSVAQVQLAASQQQAQALVLEQAQYAEVKDVQLTIQTINAGQQVGSSTEVNWRDYVVALQKTLPDGVKLETVKIEAGTPMTAYVQSDAPLQGQRVGVITFSATSKTLPDIPDWLRGLAAVPGFVDAIPGTVKSEDDHFLAEVTMHFNADAFSLRFDPDHVAAAAAAAAAGSKSDGTVKSLDGTGSDADGSTTDDGEGN